MRYVVQVVRTVWTEVEVEADSQTQALAKVDRRDFPLPDPPEWSVLKGSYEYLVMDDPDLPTDGGRSGV